MKNSVNSPAPRAQKCIFNTPEEHLKAQRHNINNGLLPTLQHMQIDLPLWAEGLL